MLCEFKQSGKTTPIDDETVLHIKVEAALEKERSMAMTGSGRTNESSVGLWTGEEEQNALIKAMLIP